ncbi:MAG: DNA mismatch repair endonuclease MutL [Deltaproteobacteria bacterium]|nr:DNA mismatch repair endonuclease MutL [Deltaproteobacteria bacterium]
MLSRIKLLPENLINRIAAGEVVERPASILKELLENSLDSGATRVAIEAEGGGKKLIRVTDDGCGMNKEELFVCLERHATSKLSPESDLLNITTLGFRGEALPSIASIAKMTITSAQKGDAEGHRITVNGGKLVSLEPISANPGSIVEVRDVFFNVPARRAFLKSTRTEEAHLIDLAQRYALSRPQLSLRLSVDGRVALDAAAQNDFAARVSKILGKNVYRSLRPLSSQDGELSIRGYLAGPEDSSRVGSNLYLYVLGRPVRDRLLLKAVTQGYGRALPRGRYPVGIVFVDPPPAEVDVNVHPAKTEVRFRDSGFVFEALAKAVASVVTVSPLLGTNAGVPAPPEPLPEDEVFERALPPPARPVAPAPPPASPAEPAENSAWAFVETLNPLPPVASRAAPSFPGQREATPPLFPPALPVQEPAGDMTADPADPSQEAARAEASPDPAPHPLHAEGRVFLKPLAQLALTYILAEGPEGLVIMDQHAAHERILFNRLKAQLETQGLPSKNPLHPAILELSSLEAAAYWEIRDSLTFLGFSLEPFGGASFALKGVPLILTAETAAAALKEILAESQGRLKSIDGGGMRESARAISESWLHSIACRAAIKAGHKLTLAEMEKLLADTLAAESGGYCPHGRPATLTLSLNSLAKKFGRK